MKFSDIQKHMSRFTVGIAGAGGLGSNCASSLVRIGIGKLVIADFDDVTESNLNRQFYFHDQVGMSKVDALKTNLLRINPKQQITAIFTRLNRDNIKVVFEGCDLIIEAFDEASEKVMLAESVLTSMPGMPLIMGSGMAGWGETASLEVKHGGDNLWICGDGISEVSDDLPPMAPRVCIVANMQANQAVEILMKK